MIKKMHQSIVGFLVVLFIVNGSCYAESESAPLISNITVGLGEYVINDAIGVVYSDGTVGFFEGSNDKSVFDKLNLRNWKNVTKLAMTLEYIVGLRSDGHILVEGLNFDASEFHDIVDIYITSGLIYAVSKDGSVYLGAPYLGTIETMDVSDVKQVAQGDYETPLLLLKNDGTVTFEYENAEELTELNNWKDIKSVSVSSTHVVGLKSDGTVVTLCYSTDKDCDASEWENVVEVIAAYDETVGLTQDGKLLFTDMNTKEKFPNSVYTKLTTNGEVIDAITDKGQVYSSNKLPISWERYVEYISVYSDPYLMSSWAKEGIKSAMDINLVDDSMISLFKQDATREDACLSALKLYELLTGKTESEISSVQGIDFKDTWSSSVSKATSLNIMGGYPDGTFRPNEKITREQIAVVLYNTIKAAYPNKDLSSEFVMSAKDSSQISNWALESMKYMNENRIINGTDDNKILPLNNATREQLILMIKNVYDKVGNDVK